MSRERPSRPHPAHSALPRLLNTYIRSSRSINRRSDTYSTTSSITRQTSRRKRGCSWKAAVYGSWRMIGFEFRRRWRGYIDNTTRRRSYRRYAETLYQMGRRSSLFRASICCFRSCLVLPRLTLPAPPLRMSSTYLQPRSGKSAQTIRAIPRH